MTSSKEHRALGVNLVCKVLRITQSVTYWADEIELVCCISSLDWRLLSFLAEFHFELKNSQHSAFEFFLRCLMSKDVRIRDAALESTVRFATNLYGPKYIHKVRRCDPHIDLQLYFSNSRYLKYRVMTACLVD